MKTTLLHPYRLAPRQPLTLAALLVLLMSGSALVAKDNDKEKGKGNGPAKPGSQAESSPAPAAAPGSGPTVVNARTPARVPPVPPSPAGKEPWIRAKVIIGPGEREIIQNYVHTCTVAPPDRVDKKKAKGLPPGLAKKVARGGQLPPGWQKKCVRGEIMPMEVRRQCHPLPQEVVVKLPPPPPGTILVAIDGKIVRLAKATREILDVFDVKLPLPPLP